MVRSKKLIEPKEHKRVTKRITIAHFERMVGDKIVSDSYDIEILLEEDCE